MSADNGIYILETKGPEFRVVHAQAIGNINWKSDKSGFNLRCLYQYFNESKTYLIKEEAFKRAQYLYEEIMKDDFAPIVEYDICEINASHIEFPKKCPPCCTSPQYNDEEDICNNCGNT